MNRKKPVRCVETGVVYESITEAGLSIDMGMNAVSMVLRGKSKTAGGYHWEYANAEDAEAVLPIIKQRPATRPKMTITEVQAEAARRTKETGKLVRYAHIQIEETLRIIQPHSFLSKRCNIKEEATP